MRVIDDDFAESCCGQTLEMPGNERLAADGQEWFGAGIGQRPHALATTGRENHGLHQKV
jgi:hypothetical protein